MLSNNVSTIVTKNVVTIDDVVIDENFANKFKTSLIANHNLLRVNHEL